MADWSYPRWLLCWEDDFLLSRAACSPMTKVTKPPPPPGHAGTPPQVSNKGLRFSMRSMLIGITVFALWCAFVSLLPAAFGHLVVGAMWFVITGWLVTGLFFARGDQRAFCIGAGLVVFSMWTDFGGQFMNGFHQLIRVGRPWTPWTDFLMIAITAIANGWVCIWARRYFQRQPAD